MPEPVNEEAKPAEKDWKAEAERKEEILRATQSKNRQYEEELTKYRSSEAERQAKETQSREESERAKLAEQGKYQEALKSVVAKHQSEIQGIFSNLNKAFVPAAIKSAAAKIKNITPEALEDLPSLISGKVRLDAKTLQPYVADDKGEPLKDEKLQPVPLESFVESFVKARSYMLVDGMPKTTGATQITSAGKPFTIENALADPKLDKEWKKTDPAGYEKALQDYAKDAPRRAREKMSNSATKHSPV